MTTQANSAFVLFMAAVRGRPPGLPGFFFSSVCEPAYSCHPIDSQQSGGNFFILEKEDTMKTQDASERFIPLTPISSDGPVLFIDSQAPLLDLHACANERLLTTLNYLNLMTCVTLRDSSDKDMSTVTNTARLLLQDVRDVLAVIESRAFIC
jgi:hypothetical protein